MGSADVGRFSKSSTSRPRERTIWKIVLQAAGDSTHLEYTQANNRAVCVSENGFMVRSTQWQRKPRWPGERCADARGAVPAKPCVWQFDKSAGECYYLPALSCQRGCDQPFQHPIVSTLTVSVRNVAQSQPVVFQVAPNTRHTGFTKSLRCATMEASCTQTTEFQAKFCNCLRTTTN